MTHEGWLLARPLWLCALLPAAWLVWRLWRAPDADERRWRQVVDAHLLPELLVGARPAARRAGAAAVALAALLAVLALAGPAREDGVRDTLRRDLTRVLVVELSPRMAEAPGRPLERLRLKLAELLRRLPDGQTALVVWAGEPYLVAPATHDAATLARLVVELTPDLPPVPGRQPETALALARAVLERSGAAVRELLWVGIASDEVVAGLAALDGVRTAVLHPGAAPPWPAQAGIELVALTDDDRDLDRLGAVLGGRGGWIGEALRAARGRSEFGAWLLLPLLALAALAFRRGVLDGLHSLGPLTLAAAAAALHPAPAAAGPPASSPTTLAAAWRDARGWQAFDAGRHAEAAARFADPHWRALALYRAGDLVAAERLLRDIDSPQAAYNHGNVLARLGRLAEAAARYEAVLQRRPDHADARHNLDVVRRLQARRPPPRGGGAASPGAAPAAATPAGREHDAARIAEQWARQAPDEPAGLLRRKLLAEQRRRDRGEAARSW